LARERARARAGDGRHARYAERRIISFPHSREIDPERALAQRQIRQTLERAIDELPKNFRTVVVARVIGR